METQLDPTSQERRSNAQIYKAHNTFTYKYTEALTHELVPRHTFRKTVFFFFRKRGWVCLFVCFARHYVHKHILRYIATIHPLPHTVTYRLLERYSSTPTHNTPTLERCSQA